MQHIFFSYFDKVSTEDSEDSGTTRNTILEPCDKPYLVNGQMPTIIKDHYLTPPLLSSEKIWAKDVNRDEQNSNKGGGQLIEQQLN